MSIVDFISQVSSVVNRQYTFFPRFTLMRMAGLGRRERRIEGHIAKEIEKIKEGEKEGSIKEVSAETKKFVKDIKREEVIQNKEIWGEEMILYNILGMMGECLKSLKGIDKQKEKIISIIDSMESYSREQMNNLKQVREGGKPWLGVVGVMKYDIGECTNIMITTSRSMRKDFSMVNSLTKDISRLANEMKDVKKAEKAENDMERRIDYLKDALSKFREKMKLHFLASLRVYRFLVDELNQEVLHVKKMEEEKLSENIVNMLNEMLKKALDKYIKDVEKEMDFANYLLQQYERAKAA